SISNFLRSLRPIGSKAHPTWSSARNKKCSIASRLAVTRGCGKRRSCRAKRRPLLNESLGRRFAIQNLGERAVTTGISIVLIHWKIKKGREPDFGADLKTKFGVKNRDAHAFGNSNVADGIFIIQELHYSAMQTRQD